MSCSARHKTALYTALNAADYDAQPQQPLLVFNIASNASFKSVLGRYTDQEAAALRQEADRLAAELRTFVAESQYELGATWPEEVFKPALGELKILNFLLIKVDADSIFIAFEALSFNCV